MNSDYLTPRRRDLILAHFPTVLPDLLDRYPVALYNAAKALEAPVLMPELSELGPERIDVYYSDDAQFPHLSFYDGELETEDLDRLGSPSTVLQIVVDGLCLYVQIGKQVFLNMLDGIELPKELLLDVSL